ncbi:MAG: hypothetical protein ACKVS8_02765 [Phycisphaerales bacterium]
MAHKGAVLALLAAAATATVANADILYATSFEAAEGFVAGVDLDLHAPWVSTTFSGAAFITDAIAVTGTQSVFFDAAPILSAWYWPSGGFDTGAPGADQIVHASVVMALEDSADPSDRSLRWGFDMYNFDVEQIACIDFLDDDSIVFYDGATDSFIDSGFIAPRDFFYQLDIFMNFAADTVDYFVNGFPIGSATLGGGSEVFGDADLRVFGAGFDFAIFDDYLVETLPVPAPSAAGVLALAGLAAARRRRA